MLRLIEAGAFAVDACLAVGLGETTYYRWLQENREFRESIKRARAKAINTRVLRIAKAGQDGDWKADAWWLERVARNRFGRNPPQEQQRPAIVLGFKPESPFIQPVETANAVLPTGDWTRTQKHIRPRKKSALDASPTGN